MTDEEQKTEWMYSIFNKDKIMAQKEQWTKEAEEAGMTLTEYLEFIKPTPCRGNGKSMTHLLKTLALDRTIEVLEQEPRKVKWTKISNTGMNCPICGSTFTLILGGDKMHYCPNCGTKMESEVEK